MSRYMGSLIDYPPPPWIPKTKAGRPSKDHNRYDYGVNCKPSDQKHTSGQRRKQKEQQL